MTTSFRKGTAMLPLLTFASGIVAGIVGVRLLKSAKMPEGLRKGTDAAAAGLGSVGDNLRRAAASGLSSVEQTSASLRAKLGEDQPVAPAAKPAKSRRARLAEAAAPIAETAEPPAPKVRKVRARSGKAETGEKPKRAGRKTAAPKPPAEPGGETS